MSETKNILPRVMMAATRMGAVLFRNQVGLGWIGRSRVMKSGEMYTARGGERIIFDPRAFHSGLIKGSGDAVGWMSTVITPEMVGRRVAIFLSPETKSVNGRMSEEQRNWQDQVTAAGGISFVCKSDEEFTERLRKYFSR